MIQGAFINETAVSTSNGFRRTYLVVFALLKGKLHGGHSQLVGEEAHVSWQLRGADVGAGAVPTTHAAQQLSLGSGEREGTHISVKAILRRSRAYNDKNRQPTFPFLG